MPSGNNVPLGNSTDDSGTGFAGLTPAPPASTGGDWASQAFAPSGSLTRQVPEQTWRPSQTALDQTVPPKPSSGFGGDLLTVDRNDERKTNPPLSNLAREHPENPVPLRGGLLGTPVNSNLVDDRKYRIDGNKRVMHDDWARIINKAPDFNGILPTFKYHVEANGDAGRADVADMLWRASQTNPAQAQSLQRELAGALGGETIPMRRALLVGEEVPKQNASGNSLLGPQQPAKYDFEQMRKSYWQSMETYKAELAQKQQAAADQTSPEMRAYPQQQDPRPGADDRKPGDETQVAFAPAAAVAAPVVIEGAAAASAAALAYWAAHPELHPKEPDWFRQMRGGSETSTIDAEAARPKIETFPAEAGKPPPLEGRPAQPPHLSGKEVFPAQEPRKGDSIIHEQRPSKPDLPDVVDMHKLPKPLDISKDGIHPETKEILDGIADKRTRDAIYETMVKAGTITHAGKGQGTNIIAPPVPRGQESNAAKAAWEEGVHKAGGKMSDVEVRKNDGITTWIWNGPNGVKLKYRDGSSQGEPTYELERDNPGAKGKDRIKIRFVPK
ncbi:MAG: hypothetical protein HQL45_12340 [Alphaproteobacteria bacterium]|nr:hypothetical protein [Alphaproteobacteria bacterium]